MAPLSDRWGCQNIRPGRDTDVIGQPVRSISGVLAAAVVCILVIYGGIPVRTLRNMVYCCVRLRRRSVVPSLHVTENSGHPRVIRESSKLIWQVIYSSRCSRKSCEPCPLWYQEYFPRSESRRGTKWQLEAAHGCIGMRCGLTRERWHVQVSLSGM